HAYVTQPGYTLVPGTDLVTVTNASTYNVSNAAIAAVAGNASQFSYVITGTPTPTAKATTYTVTGVRQVQPSTTPAASSKVIWSNATALNNVSVVLNNHGYSSGDTVAISGATDNAFNTGGSVITANNASQFTYTIASTPSGGATTSGIATPSLGIPSGWGPGTNVVISGA